jgi:hypothetical protein
MKEKTFKLPLDLYESGTLCHVLMQSMMASPGGYNAVPPRIHALYLKLTTLNDKLRGKK